MRAFLVQRLGLALLVLAAMTFVTFVMAQVIPGDPARTYAGQNASADQVAEARIKLGLDRPVLEQYGMYVERLIHGNLGTSVFTHRPVMADLIDVLPSSVELVLAAMLIDVSIAIPLGLLAAVNRGGWIDALVRLTVMAGAGIPVFWLGLLLQYLLGARLGWFPLTGQIAIGLDPISRITGLLTVDSVLQGRPDVLWSALSHLVLPALTLASAYIAVIARTIRSTMLGVLERDYITLARAKGLSEARVVIRHGLRNALIPSVTIIGMQFGWMLGGTVLVETIFGRSGIGSYAVTAVLQSDLWAVVAVVLLVGVAFVIANFLVDLAYLWLDPKMRHMMA